MKNDKIQVRNCSAYYMPNYEGITECCVISTGEIWEYDKNYRFNVLVSYSSIVAAYDYENDILFLFPRWDYSVTTLSHIRKWAEDTWLGQPLYKSDIENGDICGTTIYKCGFFTFNNREYRY